MQTHSALGAIVAAARDRPAPLVRRKAARLPGYVDGLRIRRVISIVLEALAGHNVSSSALARRHGVSKSTAKRLRAVLREFGLVAADKEASE